MALPMAIYFHRATSISILANVVGVPLLQILLPAAILAIGISYISSWLAGIPAAFAGLALHGIAGTVHWLGGWRIADTRIPKPGMFVTILAGCAILTCVILARRRAWQALSGIVLLLASTICIWEVAPHQQIRRGVLEITAIDVGRFSSSPHSRWAQAAGR